MKSHSIPSTSLLSVRDLRVSFKVQNRLLQAVRGISFDLDTSEILGIVGESGCGKSATAKALIKLLPSHSSIISGRIHFNGRDIGGLSEREMQEVRGKEIGMIFQDPMTSLNPTMRIGAQILESYLWHHPKASRKEATEYALQLLDLVGIPHPSKRINEYPHTLSGGMRQRVMIAIALAAKPPLIIADEPTTALDVTIQAQILELMHHIKEKTKTSFILITHDLSVVAGFCDRVMVMYAGRVVEKTTTSALFSRPSHPYTQGLLTAIPRMDQPDQPLIPIEGTPPNIFESRDGCAFCNRCCHAMKICELEDPFLQELHAGHEIACWRKDSEEGGHD